MPFASFPFGPLPLLLLPPRPPGPETASADDEPGVDEPGAPEAPGWPSGVAAKKPRRFPGGGSGGAATAGCRLSAMTRPGDPTPADPAVENAGGGGTTCAATSAGDRPAGIARCSPVGSWGAG